MSFPVIRSRERNLTLTGLGVSSATTTATFWHEPFNEDRLRGSAAPAEADYGRQPTRHQPDQCGPQPRHRRARQHRERQSVGVAGSRPDRFHQGRGTVGRLQQLLGSFSAAARHYGQYAFTPLLIAGAMRLSGPFLRPRLRSSAIVGDSCFDGARGTAGTTSPSACKAVTQLQVYVFIEYGKLWNHNVPQYRWSPGGVDAARLAGAFGSAGSPISALTCPSQKPSKARATTGGPSSSLTATVLRDECDVVRFRHPPARRRRR